MIRFFITLATLLGCFICEGQPLQPGFEKKEYIRLAAISARFGSSTYYKDLPVPEGYEHVYRSEILGLDNRWDLWLGRDRPAVISIRGTTANTISWLANFYAAMIPAKGVIQLNGRDSFVYRCSDDPRAAVHAGWLLSTGCMAADINRKIDSCYSVGIRDFIITGHSQGGAIAYLLTAYLRHRQIHQDLPSDIRFKTYCSAAPKPGNQQFAYTYEKLTEGGWALNVINSADWVPEVPLTVQTLDDMAKVNPFIGAKKRLRKMKFPANIALVRMYNQLDKPTRRAQKNIQKYLGNYTSGLIKKSLDGWDAPDYYNSSYYVRTGNLVILYADAEYYDQFPDDANNAFVHHMHQPYLF